MKQVEAIYGIPIEVMKYVKSQGAVGVFSENNRVYVIPLLSWLKPTLKSLFAGGELRDGQTEYLDPDQQLARLRKEQADAAARENAIANSEIHLRSHLEELLWENGLGVMRANYFAMLKKYRQQPTPSVAEQIVRDDLPKLLDTLRSMLPEKVEDLKSNDSQPEKLCASDKK